MTVMPNATVPQRMRGLGDVLTDSFFTYAPASTFVFSAANENFQTVLPIQSDAHFLCKATGYTNSAEAGNATGTTATPYVNVVNGGAIIQLTDGSNNRFLSNVQVPLNLLFGSGQLPHVWEFSFLFKANTSIGINITGTAGISQTVRLVFYGMKIPVGSRPDWNL
jgi:hypothetical protein